MKSSRRSAFCPLTRQPAPRYLRLVNIGGQIMKGHHQSYRRMIELCPAGRGGTPDEVGTVGALLMGPYGGFITGSDFLMDGGLTAAYRFGELGP
jgi:NAD(P)-dependent dehydrogenase (short-subunit alcohol dehydrogenase family)